MPNSKTKQLNERRGYKPPSSAQNNAKKVLRWKKEHGDEVKGMTAVGWTRANQLASGETLSLDTVKRMSQFNRHRKNAVVAPEYKSTPWKDRGYVAWLGWGGTSGINWAKSIVESSKSMTENKRILSLAEIKVSDEELEDIEFQVLKTGEYYDRRYGKFKIDETLLKRLKENFDSKVLGIDVALDLNHDPKGAALAWINELEVRDGALWAKFKDYTEEAKRFFKEKVYKYFSVEFKPFEKVNDGKKVTIKDVLRGIALTNRPVIKEMQPTFLSEALNNSLNRNNDMSAVKVLAERLLQRDSITKQDADDLKVAFAALSEEEQAEAQEAVDQVEAKAEADAAAEAEAGEESGEEGGEEGADDEGGNAGEEGAEDAALSEKVDSQEKQLAEQAKELAEMRAYKEAKELSEYAEGLQLSESNTTGFPAGQMEAVKKFAADLSDEQRAAFSEIIKSVQTVDAAMFSEMGHGGAGGGDDADSKEKEARELAEKKMEANKDMTKDVALAEAYAELGMI